MSQTVLFQHGLGGDEAQVVQNWPDGTDARRVTIASRGHGETPLGSDRPFSIAMFADDALDAMAGQDRFVAAGISMGAAIALALACHHPARVSALILVRPAWDVIAAPANMAPIAEIAALLRRLPPKQARKSFASGDTAVRLRAAAPDNLASLLGYADRRNAAAFAEVLADIAAGSPGVTPAQVEALNLPTLIIANEYDVIHPTACASTLADAIPGARLIRVTAKALDKNRHQREVRAAIAGFLSEQSGRHP